VVGGFGTRSSGIGSGIALAALCVAALSGCGGSQDETVRDLARHFHDAIAAGEGAAACDVLTPATREELEASTGKDCRQAVLEEQLSAVTGNGEVSVFGNMAQVDYAADTLFLARMPDGWTILAAGCAPRATGPYDCTLKGA
jgi:hypothetical protein